MRIKDFHITGQYPALSVETEIDELPGSSSQNRSVRLNLGAWNYVSLLNESELKSLVHLVYERQRAESTEAMQSLIGQSLEDAGDSELP